MKIAEHPAAVNQAWTDTTGIREELIAAGVIRPDANPALLTRVALPADVPILRLDDAGRAAAAEHMRAREWATRSAPDRCRITTLTRAGTLRMHGSQSNV